MEFFEGDEAADQRTGFTGFHAGGEEEQQGVEVVLLRHDTVFPQILRDHRRWDAMLGLVTKLKKQGVPIDGVGFESHVYTAADKINGSVLRKHFQQLAAVGLKARLSEMDVYSEDGQAVQASQYSQVLAACLNETNCISFGSWGVSDRYDWFKDDDGSVQQGQDLLWDNNMQPTPAVGAMLQVLR